MTASLATLQQLLNEIDELQTSSERWYKHRTQELQQGHDYFTAQLLLVEEAMMGNVSPAAFQQQAAALTSSSSVVQGNGLVVNGKPQGLEWESLLTPSGTPSGTGRGEDHRTPSLASPPVSHPVYDVSDEHFRAIQAAGRHHDPAPDPLLSLSCDSVAPAEKNVPCQVLVEFKRKRVLQFESPYYVAPGEYVVVGGDRGEDIGLVTHSWALDQKSDASGAARWTGGVGLGKVLRVANVLEVSQLQGVQTELETRAVEVAQEKVREHQLPMRIVDAEYQFDRKKLTFYYQSQHRLDFRNLVRDLYKTFRARIWMEQDGS
mmetsp:Transcript_19414/g.22276  ORF Transcript_19414/g.22276 Transcript_19414/m.22276 type:complete len:318 (+) Transcript_19414:58-1011(+)